MYGMLLESVQHYIQVEYGEETWKAMLEHVGLSKSVVFRTHHIYDDDLIPKLADAAVMLALRSDAKDANDASVYLRFFGRCFVRYFSHYGYEKFIKVCGRYFCDFLNGMDNMHLRMRFMYPKMKSPSMYVSHEDANGVLLHYRTTRNGYSPYLIGQLHEVATEFYNLSLQVEEVKVEEVSQGSGSKYQFCFRLNFDNGDYMASRAEVASCGGVAGIDGWDTLSPIKCSTLLRLFPLAFVFQPDLNINATGSQLLRMYPQGLMNQRLDTVVKLRRPKINCTWPNLLRLQNVLCEFEILIDRVDLSKESDVSVCSLSIYEKDRTVTKSRHLLLQGQLRYLDDWNAMIFLCNPLINSLDDMVETGICLNDMSLHGNGREMAMAGWQHCSRLEDLYEKAEMRSQQLQLTYELHDEWKQRGDKLLYSMIPQSVADTLRNGTDTLQTCQAFESVTVLFAEIANTDSMTASNVMDAVTCMNSVFSCFDNVIDKHPVYKVETVGKVYMVVGGAPDKSQHHVEDVALVALSFRDEINNKNVLHTAIPIQIRIGIHTGPAVAGVVGRKMPRYCFFGDTINTAARLQTTSHPGRIQISDDVYCRLDPTAFQSVMRGTIQVKGKGEMRTHWLEQCPAKDQASST